ncbi:MAG: adenylosuccinate lyase [Bacteroidaceae bacterium]|nr:adenylosuccinate lyase [Bacteroidaceae bacterium]
MELSPLTATSPIDGRYRSKTQSLDQYFSEYALIRYRVRVEIEYFIFLCELPLPQLASFPHDLFPQLRAIYKDFSLDDAQRVKDIEAVTNHDVKAVEYFIKEKLDAMKDCSAQEALKASKEFIHFGLTSQDINNTSVPLSLKEALNDVVVPMIQQLLTQLDAFAEEWKDIPMLAKTHGQPASPTRLGKELEVFSYRLHQQLQQLIQTPITAKFGGATGNFNAHHVAYPEINWRDVANDFVSNHLGLAREQWTTQISNYDNLAALFDALRRISTIIIDLDRDVWQYISMGYFRQKVKAGEVGSSAMPHKVNPIDFENSEGNLGIANAILEHLSGKLPISRLQRDLTDSTVLRNIGVPIGHIVIAIQSTLKGLGKLLLNENALKADLEQNWAVVAEAIQTILRREGYPNPYETLKALTRTGAAISHESIAEFIETLNVSEAVKAELRQITPTNYTGI